MVRYEAASDRGTEALESWGDADLKEPSHSYRGAGRDGVLTSNESKPKRSSVVDEVIKSLWGSASPYEVIDGQSSTHLNQRACAKGIEDHPEQLDVRASTEIAKLEELPLKKHIPPGVGKDTAELLQVRSTAQEREAAQGERGERGPSR